MPGGRPAGFVRRALVAGRGCVLDRRMVGVDIGCPGPAARPGLVVGGVDRQHPGEGEPFGEGGVQETPGESPEGDRFVGAVLVGAWRVPAVRRRVNVGCGRWVEAVVGDGEGAGFEGVPEHPVGRLAGETEVAMGGAGQLGESVEDLGEVHLLQPQPVDCQSGEQGAGGELPVCAGVVVQCGFDGGQQAAALDQQGGAVQGLGKGNAPGEAGQMQRHHAGPGWSRARRRRLGQGLGDRAVGLLGSPSSVASTSSTRFACASRPSVGPGPGFAARKRPTGGPGR